MKAVALAVARLRLPSAPLALAALAGFALLLYAPVFRELSFVWRDVSYYSYGFLLPVFSVYLVWESRRALLDASPAWWLPGIVVTSAGLTLLLLGAAVASLTLKTLSLPLVLAGLGLFVLGLEQFKAIAFAIGFLSLMAPLPDGAIATISLPLQHIASTFTAGVLTALRIPHVHNALYIHLPNVTLYVEEGCNGLRFLLAMLVVGIAFAWLTQTGTKRRTIVLGLALGVGIVSNLFRVAGTALLAYGWGPEAATGFFHMTYGKVVYGVMMIPFVVGVLMLRRSSSAASAL
jgi:exosortase